MDTRKISSTNMLERMCREIRKRTRVVGVFPSMNSLIRLIASYLMVNADAWVNERGYIRTEALEAVKVKNVDSQNPYPFQLVGHIAVDKLLVGEILRRHGQQSINVLTS